MYGYYHEIYEHSLHRYLYYMNLLVYISNCIYIERHTKVVTLNGNVTIIFTNMS